MPVDLVADSSSPKQPETKKGGKTQDKTGRKNEFENDEILNKILKDKRAFLKKSPSKESSTQKTDMSINPAPTDRKGKYIDEMV
jgi:hypothetical protein